MRAQDPNGYNPLLIEPCGIEIGVGVDGFDWKRPAFNRTLWN